MCGIAGFISSPTVKSGPPQTKRMQKALKHRGPDGHGEFFSKQVSLAMRRLSIIDVEGGNQPLYNEDKSITIIGNGEIYNYLELQKELKNKGHKLSTKSDIETIVHLYEDFGKDCVKKLRGMFVFALYDKIRNLVMLSRDRLGEKPLYYTKIKNGIAFASEMKALLKIKGVDKTLDYDAIDQFFHFYYIPEPSTGFKSVRKLPPASSLIIDLKTMQLKKTKYWNAAKINANNNDDPAEKIRKKFSESCELTLRSDVPVGILLSGGLDSSSILSISAPKYKDTMKAFSIGYEGIPASDEREMAKKLSRKFNVEFLETELKDKEVVDHFPKLVYDADDPVADISSHALYSICRFARKNNIKVLLGGGGGDELFWGYPWTAHATRLTFDKYSSLNSNLVKLLRKRTTSLQKPKVFHKNIRPLSLLACPKNQLIFNDQRPGFRGAEYFISKLYQKKFSEKLTPYNSYKFLQWSGKHNELAIAKRNLDLIRNMFLLSNVIHLNDRMSMATSVELRSPFLDYKLVETVLSSKKALLGYKMPHKYWLKRAMMDILPNEVMGRPKRGFTPPVKRWLWGILKKYSHLLQGGFLENEGILDAKRLGALKHAWVGIPFYWYQVYQILVLEIWGREYVYGISPEEIK